MYAEAEGSSECVGCTIGKHLSVPGGDEDTDCIDCAAGQYSDQRGASDCDEIVGQMPPPTVAVSRDETGKFNSGLRLKLFADIGSSSKIDGAEWTVLEQQSGGSFTPAVVMTSTGTKFSNLVVAANELQGGSTYRFVVQAGSLYGTGSGFVDVIINSAPGGGSLSCAPLEGVAVTTTFQFTVHGWQDEDRPLVYRFRVLDRDSTTMLLNDFTTSESMSALLPAGAEKNDRRLTVAVDAQDSLGTHATTETHLRVRAYMTPANTLLSTAAADLIGASHGNRDTTDQIVTGLSAYLNHDMDELDAQAKVTSSIVFETDIFPLEADSTTRAAFEVDFRQELANILNEQHATLGHQWNTGDIIIESITAPNILVTFWIAGGENAVSLAADALATLQASHTMSVLAAGMTARTSTLSTPQILSPREAHLYEAKRTRDILTDAALNAEGSSARALATFKVIKAITAKPEQLSIGTMDKVTGFVNASEVRLLPVDVVQDAADVVSNLLLASTHQYGADLTLTNAAVPEQAVRRSQFLLDVVDFLGSAMASDLISGEAETTISTDSFDIHVKKSTPAVLAAEKLGGGTVRMPVGVLGDHSGPVSSKIITWNGAGPLFYAADRSPVGASNTTKLQSSVLSVTIEDNSGVVLPVNNAIRDPFVLTLTFNESDSAMLASCAHWNESMQEWIMDGALVFRTAATIDCSFTHLTSFGGFMSPANELASVRELFDVDSWAKNVPGLVIVLSLLITIVVAVAWSWHVYTKSVRRGGRAVLVHEVASTEYGRSLFANTYKHVHRMKQISFKLRTETECGSLLWRVPGDPFARSQRMILVFITLLCGLFFSTLFFQILAEPTCLVAGDDSTCKTYHCPSCYELHGVLDCGEALPSPTEICANYRGTLSSTQAACETRPLSLCRLNGGKVYVDAADGAFCASGVYIKIQEQHVQAGTGDRVNSHCVEHESGLLQMIVSSVFASACTLPVVAVLSKLFDRLREPVERAITGDYHIHLDRSCCGIVKAYLHKHICCKQQVRVSPARLQSQAMHRLERITALGAAVPYLSALSVGITCVVLIALVLVTFNAATTRLWLLSSVMSVFMSWTANTLKMAVVTTICGYLKCKQSRKWREVGNLVRATTRTQLGSTWALDEPELAVEGADNEDHHDDDDGDGDDPEASGGSNAEMFGVAVADRELEALVPLAQAWDSLSPHKHAAAEALGWDETTWNRDHGTHAETNHVGSREDDAVNSRAYETRHAESVLDIPGLNNNPARTVAVAGDIPDPDSSLNLTQLFSAYEQSRTSKKEGDDAWVYQSWT
jgi:hypothetical protein